MVSGPEHVHRLLVSYNAATPQYIIDDIVSHSHVWALMSIIQGRFILRTEMARRHKEGVRGDVLPIQKVSANDLELSTLPPYRPRDMDMDFS